MPEICSCGAQLVPDSLFCHKCGKPQRDLVEPEPAPAPTYLAAEPAAAAARPEPLPLNFHNPIAVRIAMLVALCAALLGFTFLPILSWMAAGFFATLFYKRKTGSLLNVGGGVRIGWITGIIMFGIWTVVLTALAIPAAVSGRLLTTFQEQMRNSPWQDPAMLQQMTHMLQTGEGIATAVVVFFFMLFVFIISLSMAGGALGAMLGRD
ncbi:MAG TPA: hypothetical protein VG456_20905 [Candidatus Sulfopaludibacter sp.]|jgi:hypothetical protein|nr:hypothetical protein [Candidatus Sulfopaludibacter sp.]